MNNNWTISWTICGWTKEQKLSYTKNESKSLQYFISKPVGTKYEVFSPFSYIVGTPIRPKHNRLKPIRSKGKMSTASKSMLLGEENAAKHCC